MARSPSPPSSSIKVISPQADPNGDGTPSQQDHLTSTFVIPDTPDTSLQILPYDDDLSTSSSVSLHFPWDVDALPFADGYPDSRYDIDGLTELAAVGLPDGQGVESRPLNTSYVLPSDLSL